MIYTVTLNPCLDRHLEIDELKVDDANRVRLETRYPAGKGIDVSIVIAELGGRSTALGFVGGFTGLELEGMLVNRGVRSELTRIAGDTRTNVHVTNRATGHQTSFNASGPVIKDSELGAFCHTIKNLDPAPKYVAVSGSVPRGVTDRIYEQIITWTREDGAFVVLDSDGAAFRAGLEAKPFMIKPNLHELSRYFDRDLREAGFGELETHCRHFLQLGVQVVVVSLGRRGLLLKTEEHARHVAVPEIDVKSTIGSGDSVIGGILYRLDQGSDLVEAVTWGAACGTATAMTSGTALCRKEDVRALLPQIRLSEL